MFSFYSVAGGAQRTGCLEVAGGDGLISLMRAFTIRMIWFLSASPFMPTRIRLIMFSLEANSAFSITSNIHFSKSFRDSEN